MKKILILAIAIIAFSGCTNKTDAKRALKAQGFKNVQITGCNFFACGKDDFYRTGFTAVNQQGSKVSGTVCSGLLFKNATVRF